MYHSNNQHKPRLTHELASFNRASLLLPITLDDKATKGYFQKDYSSAKMYLFRRPEAIKIYDGSN